VIKLDTITEKTAKLAIASSTQSTLRYMSCCSAVAGRHNSLNFQCCCQDLF